MKHAKEKTPEPTKRHETMKKIEKFAHKPSVKKEERKSKTVKPLVGSKRHHRDLSPPLTKIKAEKEKTSPEKKHKDRLSPPKTSKVKSRSHSSSQERRGRPSQRDLERGAKISKKQADKEKGKMVK